MTLRPLARTFLALALTLGAPAATHGGTPPPETPAALGPWLVLSWNDLGMHCMNNSHANISVLPPYNNLIAQVIHRGDATHLPTIVTSGVTLEYSVPGNTSSVNKTDFWTYAPALFGVNLPANIGLTGKGLTGSLDPSGSQFAAHGIPVTPFPDATPTTEDPYQQALIIARDGGGAEIARSTPVIPVSVEMHCLGSGCHSSESSILNSHPREAGFNPNARPILCAGCHADPALGTTGIREAKYFSFRMHDQHKFMDEDFSGTTLCYKCHPGGQAQCLRGTMSTDFGLVCQDCHGSMSAMSSGIEHGRTPWVQEPACRTCHTAQYGEPVGQLFRNSTGHGGVACAACHGSPHAEFPSRISRDNDNMVTLQGHAGVLSDCTVCHGVTPSGAGPHGMQVAGVLEQEIVKPGLMLRVYPNPTRGACNVEFASRALEGGALVVFDAQGRAVTMLAPREAGDGLAAASWDGHDSRGRAVSPGVYFLRWRNGAEESGAKLLITR